MSELLRTDQDSIGSIEVPIHALWGAQTQRSLVNFSIGHDRMPLELIYALAKIKRAAAKVNHRLGVLEKTKKDLIVQAASEIENGLHDSQFPLHVWQTGSGTHTNMNVNEVISNLASSFSNEPLGSNSPIHPNDHVNCSQSTNDTYPAAIQIAVIQKLTKNLLPELTLLIEALRQKSQEWDSIIKVGRTHLQDAVPITLGQEVSAWKEQIAAAHKRITIALEELYQLPLGGTAVGTGLNAPRTFGKEIAKELALLTGLPFISANNKFSIMASHDGLVHAMAELKMLAIALFKIVNDIRLLSCGPRAGLGELELPTNEPGSSIMPGKVNPTQCEAMAMVCTQVIGLEAAVSLAGSSGQLQMNAYKPLIGFNLLESIQLLNDACHSCRIAMIEGLKPNLPRITQFLDQSLMLITALAPKIGYEKASKIAQLAHTDNISLRQAALSLGYVNESEFNQLVDPKAMTQPTN